MPLDLDKKEPYTAFLILTTIVLGGLSIIGVIAVMVYLVMAS